jgi:hypothetical protein
MGLPAIAWGTIYQAAWDADPGAYVAAGLVGWGRSRRLGRVVAPAQRFKAYIGVQHFDPARWGVAGEAQAKFFLSLFVAGRTVALHTHPTIPAALAELAEFYQRLDASS